MSKYRVTTPTGTVEIEGPWTMKANGSLRAGNAVFAPGQWLSCVPVKVGEEACLGAAQETPLPPADSYSEPWNVVACVGGGYIILEADGSIIGQVTTETDARLIVDCVNAAVGKEQQCTSRP